MSFPDHPPPLPFTLPPFGGGEVGGFWPQIPMNNEYADSHSQFDYPPPFKRLRNSENNLSNSSSFPPMNPRMIPQNLPVNKGTTHIFFKTRICVKFMEGSCRNEENCTFAHGPAELRQPPPNWQELVNGHDRAGGNWNDDQKIIHRMKICKKFYNGEECPYGNKCNFLHEDPSKFKTDIEMPRESSFTSIGTEGPIMGHRNGFDQPEIINNHVSASSDVFRANLKPVYWKTRLCSKWEATGQCPFREKCHFAHGLSELQVPLNRIEAEVSNTNSIPTNPIFGPVNDSSLSTDVVISRTEEEGEHKKGLSKWKVTKKINRIYADWIDDLTPPHNHPSTVES